MKGTNYHSCFGIYADEILQTLFLFDAISNAADYQDMDKEGYVYNYLTKFLCYDDEDAMVYATDIVVADTAFCSCMREQLYDHHILEVCEAVGLIDELSGNRNDLYLAASTLYNIYVNGGLETGEKVKHDSELSLTPKEISLLCVLCAELSVLREAVAEGKLTDQQAMMVRSSMAYSWMVVFLYIGHQPSCYNRRMQVFETLAQLFNCDIALQSIATIRAADDAYCHNEWYRELMVGNAK